MVLWGRVQTLHCLVFPAPPLCCPHALITEIRRDPCNAQVCGGFSMWGKTLLLTHTSLCGKEMGGADAWDSGGKLSRWELPVLGSELCCLPSKSLLKAACGLFLRNPAVMHGGRQGQKVNTPTASPQASTRACPALSPQTPRTRETVESLAMSLVHLSFILFTKYQKICS